MSATQLRQPLVSYTIEWEKLPDDFKLPDDPVENINHPLLASALREILEIAGLIGPTALIVSNFAICATVNKKTVVKAPDWCYVPNVLPVPSPFMRRSYTPNLEGDIPAVVMEFISDTEQGEYSVKPTYPYGKWFFYERIVRVPIYVIFEQAEGRLEVHDLADGRYELRQPDANGRYFIASLGLYLGVWQGTKASVTGYWLRWWDESNNMLPWTVEGVQQSREEGRLEGIEEGIKEGKIDLIMRLLTRQIGEISDEAMGAIANLSVTDLDELSEALFDFNSSCDLASWLEK
ncbi:MAG: DUF4351 domain-containing protein [Cyanobacteriota bacterium]|nr:DUF4351 domain-containing protein [Cyanobacteriota bacterium]